MHKARGNGLADHTQSVIEPPLRHYASLRCPSTHPVSLGSLNAECLASDGLPSRTRFLGTVSMHKARGNALADSTQSVIEPRIFVTGMLMCLAVGGPGGF